MKRISVADLLFISNKSIKIGRKKCLRKLKKNKRKISNYINVSNTKEIKRTSYKFYTPDYVKKTPKLSSIVSYILTKHDCFCSDTLLPSSTGHFLIPSNFSLSQEPKESYSLLKSLLLTLEQDTVDQIIIDYKICLNIDLDASICMDVLLKEFIAYFKECDKNKIKRRLKKIIPRNYDNENVAKILFSIGTFSNISGLSLDFPDITKYKLSVGTLNTRDFPEKREVHITQLVDYVLQSISKMKKTLGPEPKSNLYKVIGEVLINAEEHSTTNRRYSIGYFQEKIVKEEHVGVFNLVIMNFGSTIYEKFKDPECGNQEVVNQMNELSSKYTQNGFFTTAKFEEETLWTLYALQEGVTSHKDWKRGNGSICFIDSFFKLNSIEQSDNFDSVMIIKSGHTQILFNGKYKITEKNKDGIIFKMMTFNENGEIENKPDSNYVKHTDNYFPGTMITAKIVLKE